MKMLLVPCMCFLLLAISTILIAGDIENENENQDQIGGVENEAVPTKEIEMTEKTLAWKTTTETCQNYYLDNDTFAFEPLPDNVYGAWTHLIAGYYDYAGDPWGWSNVFLKSFSCPSNNVTSATLWVYRCTNTTCDCNGSQPGNGTCSQLHNSTGFKVCRVQGSWNEYPPNALTWNYNPGRETSYYDQTTAVAGSTGWDWFTATTAVQRICNDGYTNYGLAFYSASTTSGYMDIASWDGNSSLTAYVEICWEDCVCSSGACCTDSCHFDSSSTQCRASAGDCDVAENCTGSSADCPSNSYRPSSYQCRASAGDCDIAENCSGSSPNCPANSYRPSSYQCRASAGDCDIAENCSGSSPNCPANSYRPSSYQCRASAGDCDIAENCTGSSANCPDNAFRPSSYECRASAGQCDIAENCTGSSANCPSNGYQPNGTSCTDTLFCNGDDSCQNGQCNQHTGNPCPPDTTCKELTDSCDPNSDDDGADDTGDDADDDDADDTTDDDADDDADDDGADDDADDDAADDVDDDTMDDDGGIDDDGGDDVHGDDDDNGGGGCCG